MKKAWSWNPPRKSWKKSTANIRLSGHPILWGELMKNKKEKPKTECIRLDPESQLCPAFDSTSIKLFAAPDAGEMGVRVLDNCAEEHMQ